METESMSAFTQRSRAEAILEIISDQLEVVLAIQLNRPSLDGMRDLAARMDEKRASLRLFTIPAE